MLGSPLWREKLFPFLGLFFFFFFFFKQKTKSTRIRIICVFGSHIKGMPRISLQPALGSEEPGSSSHPHPKTGMQNPGSWGIRFECCLGVEAQEGEVLLLQWTVLAPEPNCMARNSTLCGLVFPSYRQSQPHAGPFCQFPHCCNRGGAWPLWGRQMMERNTAQSSRDCGYEARGLHRPAL